jgi:hypothetical protein
MSEGDARPRKIPVDLVVESGALKSAESTDPYVATAVALPTPGYDGMAAMGRAFVEEFAMLGWSRERLERMFRMPRYVAAHVVYVERGPAFVTNLIDEVLGRSEDGERKES